MVRDITTEDFVNMLNSEEEVIPLDVLSRNAREDMVIKNAIRCSVEDINEWADEHFDRKDEKIIIFCGGNICGSLIEAAALLEDKGFTSLYKYDGRVEDLSDAGLDLKYIEH
ncbi:MAG: rhodanese-like domain-containing protein [Nitrospirae bacterium]|nr:rhodanese-like domain-containing protein [Nitrospirota bacterium]